MRDSWSFLGRLSLLGLVAGLAGGCHSGQQAKVLWSLASGAGPEYLALSPDGGTLAVSCPAAQEVWLYSTAGKPVFLKKIEAAREPLGLEFGPEGRIYVCEGGSAEVAELSQDEGRVLRRTACRAAPVDISFIPDGSRFFVSCTDPAQVEAFFTESLRPEKDLQAGGIPQQMVMRADMKTACVATRAPDTLAMIYLPELAFQSAVAVDPDPKGVAFSTSGDLAYVACAGRADAEGVTRGALDFVGLKDLVKVDHAEVGAGAFSVAVSPSGNYLFVTCPADGQVDILSAASHQVKARLKLPGSPRGLALSRDGGRAYVALEGSNQVAVLDLGDFE